MENLKNILNKITLDEYCSNVYSFIQSTSNEPNKLKLTIALCILMEECSNALRHIDSDSFISEVKERMNTVILESQKSKDIHQMHFIQNKNILQNILEDTPFQLNNLTEEIAERLSEFDRILKELISIRELLPIEKIQKNKG